MGFLAQLSVPQLLTTSIPELHQAAQFKCNRWEPGSAFLLRRIQDRRVTFQNVRPRGGCSSDGEEDGLLEAVAGLIESSEPLPNTPENIGVGAMSKRQAKRIARQERYLKQLQDKRKAAKARKRAEAEAEQWRFESLDPVAQAEILGCRQLAKEASFRARESFRSQRELRIADRGAPLQRVAIDIGYRGIMTKREERSLASQLAYCQAENKRSLLPLDLVIVGLDTSSSEGSALMKWNPENWSREPYGIKVYYESLDACIPPHDCVYLSADSANEIETLDSDKVYVVGAIVDRNRCVDASRLRAESLGITTARLPIQKFCDLDSSSVLAVNHIVSILMRVAQGSDMGTAIRDVVPPRKVSKDSTSD
eukprot:CAMPEP_0184319986 /NCGR_PEP_ID=MMETSP1049-20130417/111654_1 /TAXON_ID=77928 /ORGANISM="Proteomonas sulcata, Strain CCMP704" /LENGTH=365 /DNA_ID=CAMNT_0026640335 /DNA_START=386 /DNA_END=1483 /DNA_ORIENTATION=-